MATDTSQLASEVTMANGPEPLKISLDSLGLTLTNTMPTLVWNRQEQNTLRNCAPESLQKSFVFVSENGGDEDGSIVVLGKNSLEDIQAQSMATFKEIHDKSLSMDCQSIISSLTPGEVEEKLTVLLQENLRLKETLEKNNLAMKQHLSALVTKQEELAAVHEAHRQKFIETKNLVTQLKLENSELLAKAEETEKKESKDESSQTEKEEKEAKAEPEILTPTIDNEFAEEMLKMAEKLEEQTKEIAHLQKVIGSLNRQLEPVYRNLFTGVRLEDVRSSDGQPEESHRRNFLECFTHYNEKLRALGNSYAAQASRYTRIQESLKRCSEIVYEKELSFFASATSEDSGETPESQKRKELQEHRSKLIDEELKTIVERQEMIQAQNEFQKIFTHYNSTLLELESLRQERERLTSLQRGVTLHEERLNEAKESLKASEKLLEEQRRGIERDRLELSEQKQALERERLRLQEEEHKVIEANASLNEELVNLRETNNLLQHQCKIYEDDFADELKLRENMMSEKEHLLMQMQILENERRGS